MQDTKIVTAHIGYGKDNAITRSTLALLTGLPDREIRRAIEQDEDLIINNGSGYFKPLPEEIDEVKHYQLVMSAKAKSELDRVDRCTRWIYERF